MAFQFDGAGRFELPSWSASGDFRIEVTFTFREVQAEIIIGNSSATDVMLGCLAGGIVRARITPANAINLSGHTDGVQYTAVWERAGSTVTLTTDVATGSITDSDSLVIDRFGWYFSGFGGYIYSGKILGSLSMAGGAGSDDRIYDFNQDVGETTLPDILNSQDASAVGFSSGDFDGITLAGVSITSLSNNQCLKADTHGGSRTVTISGSLSGYGSAPASMEYSINSGPWIELDASPTTTTFSGSLTLSGQNDIRVRPSDDITSLALVSNISITYNVIIAWQSNGQGYGDNNQSYEGVNDAFKVGLSGTFQTMIDPTGTSGSARGSIWPLWATKVLDSGVIPCISNICVGGTSITTWMDGGLYFDRIENAANYMGGANAVIMVGGEADRGTNMTTFEANLNQFVDDNWSVNGLPTYICLMVQGSGIDLTEGNEVRAVQQNVIDTNPNAYFGGDLSVVDVDSGVSPDGVHILTDEALEHAAQIIFDAVQPRGVVEFNLLEGASGSETNYSGAFTGRVSHIGGEKITDVSETADGINPIEVSSVYIHEAKEYELIVEDIPSGKLRGEIVTAS